MEKEFFDIDSLPKDAVKIKLSKNLQFVFEGMVKNDRILSWKHIYTEDSLKRVVLMASKELKKKDSDYTSFRISVFDANGEGLTVLGIVDIADLYILREYLK